MKKIFLGLSVPIIVLLAALNFSDANFMEDDSDELGSDEVTTEEIEQPADGDEQVVVDASEDENVGDVTVEDTDEGLVADQEGDALENDSVQAAGITEAEGVEEDDLTPVEEVSDEAAIEQDRKEALEKAKKTKSDLAQVIVACAKDAREIEFRPRIEKTGKVAIPLTQYLSMRFWQFSDRVVNRKYDPAVNALYDDSGLGLEDSVMEAYAIAVEALRRSSMATRLFIKTPDGKELYDQIVLEPYQMVQERAKEYKNALEAYQKSPTNDNYKAFRQARLDQVSAELGLAKATKKYRLSAINYKFVQAKGTAAFSVADFLKLEGGCFVQRTRYYKDVQPYMDQFAGSLGMSSQQMVAMMASGKGSALTQKNIVQDKINAAKQKYAEQFKVTAQKFNQVKTEAKQAATTETAKQKDRLKQGVVVAADSKKTALSALAQAKQAAVEAGRENVANVQQQGVGIFESGMSDAADQARAVEEEARSAGENALADVASQAEEPEE